MTPEATFLSALFGVLALILWAGCVDATLYLRGEPTVSAWLRVHQLWFIVPMSVALIFLAVLTLHLYLEI